MIPLIRILMCAGRSDILEWIADLRTWVSPLLPLTSPSSSSKSSSSSNKNLSSSSSWSSSTFSSFRLALSAVADQCATGKTFPQSFLLFSLPTSSSSSLSSSSLSSSSSSSSQSNSSGCSQVWQVGWVFVGTGDPLMGARVTVTWSCYNRLIRRSGIYF